MTKREVLNAKLDELRTELRALSERVRPDEEAIEKAGVVCVERDAATESSMSGHPYREPGEVKADPDDDLVLYIEERIARHALKRRVRGARIHCAFVHVDDFYSMVKRLYAKVQDTPYVELFYVSIHTPGGVVHVFPDQNIKPLSIEYTTRTLEAVIDNLKGTKASAMPDQGVGPRQG